MKVYELIEWLKEQDQQADVKVLTCFRPSAPGEGMDVSVEDFSPTWPHQTAGGELVLGYHYMLD